MIYSKNIDIIRENRSRCCAIDGDILDGALESVHNSIEDIKEEIETINKNKLNKEEVHIFERGKKEESLDKTYGYTALTKLAEDKIYRAMEESNFKQREIVLHILHCVKKNGPFYIFLIGSGGVGKSIVINVICQTLSYYVSNMPRWSVELDVRCH